MNRLFRKVMCSERLPKEEGYYPTDMGSIYFNPKFEKMNSIYNADWWLEPVEIPTDEEIEKIAFEIDPDKDSLSSIYRSGYYRGYLHAIGNLTKEK